MIMLKGSLSLKRFQLNSLKRKTKIIVKNTFLFSFLFFYCFVTKQIKPIVLSLPTISNFVLFLFLWKLGKMSLFQFQPEQEAVVYKRKYKYKYFKPLYRQLKYNKFRIKELLRLTSSKSLFFKKSKFNLFFKFLRFRRWRTFFNRIKKHKKLFYKNKNKKRFFFKPFFTKRILSKKICRSLIRVKNFQKYYKQNISFHKYFLLKSQNIFYQNMKFFQRNFLFTKVLKNTKKNIFHNLFFWYKKRIWRFKKSKLYEKYMKDEKKYDIFGIWKPKFSYKMYLRSIKPFKKIYRFAFVYKHFKNDLFLKRCLFYNYKMVRFYSKRRFKKIKRRLFRFRFPYSRFFYNYKKINFSKFLLIQKHLMLLSTDLNKGRFTLSSKPSLFSFHFLKNLLIHQTQLTYRFVERNLFAGLFFEPLNHYFFFNYYFNRVFWSGLVMDLFSYHRTYQQNNF